MFKSGCYSQMVIAKLCWTPWIKGKSLHLITSRLVHFKSTQIKRQSNENCVTKHFRMWLYEDTNMQTLLISLSAWNFVKIVSKCVKVEKKDFAWQIINLQKFSWVVTERQTTTLSMSLIFLTRRIQLMQLSLPCNKCYSTQQQRLNVSFFLPVSFFFSNKENWIYSSYLTLTSFTESITHSQSQAIISTSNVSLNSNLKTPFMIQSSFKKVLT